MTPKEKAEELVEKYNNFLNSDDVYWEDIIQCALIAADEIIKSFHTGKRYNYGKSFNYWNEVKAEIEKL